MKVNITPSSQHASISHLNPPANSSSTDINTTIKGTVEELLKKHQQQTPTNIPVPHVNNPINRFQNRNQQTYPLGDILSESKKKNIKQLIH